MAQNNLMTQNNQINVNILNANNINNALISNAKIADFGFAIKAKEKFKDLSIGSPIYMSPEGLV